MGMRIENSFIAIDGRGKQYKILVIRHSSESRTMHGRYETPDALASLQTDDERAVNWIEKGKYEIVGNPMIPITTDDPNAP